MRIALPSAIILAMILCTTGCAHGDGKVSSTQTSTQVGGSRVASVRTRIVNIRPTTTKGLLKPGYIVTRHQRRGTCQQDSMVVGGEYRCSANGIYDPCWAAGQPASAHVVFCLLAPWEKTVTRITLDGRLETYRLGTSELSPRIWALGLASGKRCIVRQGAGGEFHGVPVRFSCITGSLEVLGEPNKSDPLWTVQGVYFHAIKGPPYRTYYTYGPVEHVAVVWYGLGAAE
jgi:hypothetical protein